MHRGGRPEVERYGTYALINFDLSRGLRLNLKKNGLGRQKLVLHAVRLQNDRPGDAEAVLVRIRGDSPGQGREYTRSHHRTGSWAAAYEAVRVRAMEATLTKARGLAGSNGNQSKKTHADLASSSGSSAATSLATASPAFFAIATMSSSIA